MQTVTYKEGDHWIIQGLERDICASGSTLEQAKSRFDIAVYYEEYQLGGLEHLPQAPKRFWDMERDSEGIGR